MPEKFPYQLVGFLDNEPTVGEAVYEGKNGWYAQIALKRRFRVMEMGENELKKHVEAYCAASSPLEIRVGGLIQPKQMPVKVLEVEQNQRLMKFHKEFIESFGSQLVSRYPERDGDHYYPHVTAEYGGKDVIDAERFVNKEFTIQRVWLLKDVEGGDSAASVSFALAQ